MKQISNTRWMYLLLGFFVLCFVIFYPKMLLILDEYSYFNRGLALSNLAIELEIPDLTNSETIGLSGSRYLPGTILLIALFTKIFGNSGVFLIGLFSYVLTVLLMIKVLRTLEFNPLGVLILFTFPALLMLSRTVMSGMPSLLCSAIFFYVLICHSKSRWQYFILALVAGLATLFRETNILVFGLFGLSLFWQKKKWLGYLASGFALGVFSRLLLSKYLYGDIFYRSYAEPFSLSNILTNLPLYLMLGLVLLPVGLFQIYTYQGKYKWELKFSVFIFFLLYLSYGYSAVEYSGFAKALLFGGRFLVPILPLFVIAAGFFINKYNWLQKGYMTAIMISVGFFCIFFSHYRGHQYNNTHYAISQKIYTQYKDQPIVMDHSGYTSINRYINPLLGLIPKQADLNRFTDKEYVQRVMSLYPQVYIAVSMRFENAEKKERADRFTKILQELKKDYKLEKVEEMSSFDGTTVQVWQMQ